MTNLADRYELGDKIGTGAMGEVYRAVDTLTGNTVAIKALKQSLVQDDDLTVLQRFLQEADALRQLAHPNIVKILDSFEHEGQHFIVMEYLSGGSLRERVTKNGPLPVEETVAICLELADALSRAHHLGIIHRDIKPENVLLAEDNTPRLTDFGIASLPQHDSTALTEGDMVMGTLPYMSPEALNGEPQDTRADIWAFGVMMYELLAGIRPFRGKRTLDLIQSIMLEEPDLVTLPEISPSLVTLLHQMLEKDPAQRIGSARQVGAFLEMVLNSPSGDQTHFVDSASIVRHAIRTLPVVPTNFVGRDADTAEVKKLVTSPDYRFVTLIGPGGIGKTRLALEVARQVPDVVFRNGVRFVDLTPVQAAEHIVSTIATAVGYQFPSNDQQSQETGITRSNEDHLMDYFSEKNMLLVVDGAEHLPDSVFLLERILTKASNVTILVTSRVPLNSRWEYLYEVHGLPVDQDAITLFAERAVQVQPRFDPESEVACVARICQLMEGMPLGLELAATWLRVMSCQELTEELSGGLSFLESRQRTVDQRHSSLQAVFEQSWRLLTDNQREGLMRLSVFKGRFTRDAARHVASAGLGVLTALVDQSLVQVTPEGRYRLHEMVRQFSAVKLAKNADAEHVTLDDHADYYSRLIEQQLPRLKSGDMPEALLDIDSDIDNSRAAWHHAVAMGHIAPVQRMAESLHHYLVFRANYSEGVDLYATASEAFAGQDVAIVLQIYQAAFHIHLYEHTRARQLLETIYDRVVALNDPAVLASTLTNLGRILIYPEDIEQGREYLKEALALYETLNDAFALSSINQFLGSTYFDKDDAKSLSYHDASLEWARRSNNQWQLATTLINIGEILRVTGNTDRALDHFQEALDYARQFGHSGLMGECLYSLGSIHLFTYRNNEQANVLTRQALSLVRNSGDKSKTYYCLRNLGWIASYQQDIETCEFYWEQAYAVAKSMGSDPELRRSFHDLALLEASRGNFKKSAQYTEQATIIAERLGELMTIAVHYSNMSYMVYKVGRYHEGKDYAEKSLAVWANLPDVSRPLNLATSYLNLAHNLIELGEYQAALENYRTVYPFIAGNFGLIQELMTGVAKAIGHAGQLEIAIKLLRFTLNQDLLGDFQTFVQRDLEKFVVELAEDERQVLLVEADRLTHKEAVAIMLNHPIWQEYGLEPPE